MRASDLEPPRGLERVQNGFRLRWKPAEAHEFRLHHPHVEAANVVADQDRALDGVVELVGHVAKQGCAAHVAVVNAVHPAGFDGDWAARIDKVLNVHRRSVHVAAHQRKLDDA